MKNRVMVILIAFITLLSCSQMPRRYGKPLTQEETAEENRKLYLKVEQKIQEGKVQFEGGNGLSLEKAIEIKGARNTDEGIAAENIWIMERHGERGIDWNKLGQSLDFSEDNRRQFDIIDIEIISTGEKIGYFFDITSFFGKW